MTEEKEKTHDDLKLCLEKYCSACGEEKVEIYDCEVLDSKPGATRMALYFLCKNCEQQHDFEFDVLGVLK